jgi:hypothetical protein
MMERDPKVVPHTGVRQGRTGQAGREVGRLLGAILDPAARRRGFAQASLLSDWPSIVGPALARRCQPVRVDYAPGRRRGGALVVQASGAVALEVQHAAPQIVERVNGYFGFPAVRQLRLLQMPFRPPPLPRETRPRPLQPEEEAALAGAVGEVGDEELREALLALGRAVRGGRS